jgi:hypothetical protein
MNLSVKKDIERLVELHIHNPRDIEINFNLGWSFESIGQHASALTHYSKISELAEDKLSQYEALIRMAENFRKHKGRPTSERAMLLHAKSLISERPEAYLLLAKHYLSENMHHEADSYLSLYKERLSFATWEPLRVPIKPLAWDYDLIQMQTEWMLGRGPSARDYARKLMNEYKLPKDIALSARQYVGKVNGDMYPVRRYRKGETTFALSFKNLERIDTNYAQALQDMFVLAVLDGKENGTYLEIGSNAPIYNNNTYLLEQFNWRGVSVELEASYNNEFNLIRKNPAMTEDATECHYDYLLETYGIGKVVDYLQVDCEPAEVTFKALQKIPFDKYTFRVITYEHDFYQDPEGKYRELSREYLTNLGYELIIGNVGTDLNNNFEDWYVHPVHVDMKRTVTLKDTSSSIVPIHKHLLI